MNEVGDFLSSNELVSLELREFALAFDRLSEVWTHCDRPDWLLDLLKRRCNGTHGYRCSEGLETYIDSLKEMIMLHCHQPNEIDEHYFSYKRGISSIKGETESGAISIFEGDRRCFVWLWLTAYEAMRYVFENEVDRFEFDRVAEKIIAERVGIEPAPDGKDETEFKRDLFSKQAGLLRAAVADPFR
jgi:hypothetical protein